MKRVLAVACAVLGAACGSPSSTITIHARDGMGAGVELALTDLIVDLGRISGRPVVRGETGEPGCVDGELHVVVRPIDPGLGAQEYAIAEERCGDGGRTVVLRGGSLLAQQWAVYDLLERLGVRYLHPEETLYPAEVRWPVERIEVVERPAFWRRSFNAHRTHPIELSTPLDTPAANAAGFQRRWIDWNVKVRSTEVNGWDEGVIGTYPYDRGFPRSAGLNLLNGQQGGRPVLDADDPRPESVQIAEAIDEQFAPREGVPPVTSFGFQFNPNEFTTADERLTVERISFITTYINERWPDVEVRTINHGTAQEAGPVYGVRFFDLSQHAPPSLAVQAHTLMFYDLERPAPVYGNASFRFLRDFIVREQAVRRMHYYPESSWWLTFDLPVPLYLAPVSLEARDHDLKLLAPYLADAPDAATGVVGHHTFTSGQEWGYWLIDYCTARMTWDLDLGWVGCLDHVTSAFVDGDVVRDVIEEVGRAQVEPLRDPAILAMLVGSDDETEAATLAGIHFHPLPPPPADVLRWDDAQVAAFRADSLAPLPAFADAYAARADTLDAIAANQSEEHAPWVREIADGLRITGLRARHALAIYESTLALRAAIAARDFAGVAAAEAGVAHARAITDAARDIVRRREDAYRYPEQLTILGDEPGTPGAIPNQTIYPYRYLSRTHRLFYWTRPDEQLASMFAGDQITVSDRILVEGTPLDVSLLVEGITQLAIAWGDGVTGTTLAPHTYAAQGIYDWVLDAVHALGAVRHEDRAAVVARRITFPKGSLDIVEPAGAAVIEGLLPGLVVGPGEDASGPFLALGQTGAQPIVERGTVQRLTRTGSTTGSTTAATDIAFELRNVGRITVDDAILTLADGTGPTDRRLSIAGGLSTAEVIALIVSTGGFDAQGAREVVATQLGYTPETLPERLTFRIVAVGTEP